MIKILRKYLDLSVNDVSNALNLDKKYIYDIESKKIEPQYNLIRFYSKKTGIDITSLETILMYSGTSLFKKTAISCMYKYFKIVLYLKRK